VFYRLKDRVRRGRFENACRGVLEAAPISSDSASSFVLVSQVQHKDVLMYLLAVKSFAKRLRPQAVHVIDDGSLSANDRGVLRDHVPDLTLLELAQFRSHSCPSGGTWERLLAIARLVQDNYVIQLDSDTLTLGAMDEVRNAVTQEHGFVIGTWNNQKMESMRERCATAKKLVAQPNSHVQLVAEANLDKLTRFESLSYVRGCSGFAGFPRRSFTREFVETTSSQMREGIGARWNEWGSEQVMSNIVVANMPAAMVLPHPKYADCNKMKPGITEFVHFIGSCRFDRGTYATLGAQAIASL